MLGRAPDFDYDLLWEAELATENVYPLRQIVFHHPLAEYHPVPILDSMRGRPEVLTESPQDNALENKAHSCLRGAR